MPAPGSTSRHQNRFVRMRRRCLAKTLINRRQSRLINRRHKNPSRPGGKMLHPTRQRSRFAALRHRLEHHPFLAQHRLPKLKAVRPHNHARLPTRKRHFLHHPRQQHLAHPGQSRFLATHSGRPTSGKNHGAKHGCRTKRTEILARKHRDEKLETCTAVCSLFSPNSISLCAIHAAF